jgi:hypothetical protein
MSLLHATGHISLHDIGDSDLIARVVTNEGRTHIRVGTDGPAYDELAVFGSADQVKRLAWALLDAARQLETSDG